MRIMVERECTGLSEKLASLYLLEQQKITNIMLLFVGLCRYGFMNFSKLLYAEKLKFPTVFINSSFRRRTNLIRILLVRVS